MRTPLRSDTNAAVEKVILIWTAHAALACGDLVRARRWADEAAAATNGMFLCLALAARIRVHVAEGNNEQAAADAYEGLAIAAPMAGYLCVPDLLESLAELANDAGSPQQAVRLLGAALAMRERFELARFKVYEDSYQALVALLRSALGDSEFDAFWADGATLSPEEAIAYAQRGRANASDPRRVGDHSRRRSSTSSASSAKDCPTRTSPPGCSSRHERSSRTCSTSTTS